MVRFTRWSVLVALALTGCPKYVPCQTRAINLYLVGGANLNPDDRGRPLPANITVFQLKDTVRFENASFSDLWNDPKGVLQEDLVDTNDLALEPSRKVTRSVLPKQGTTHVAVAALFREPSGTTWRYVRMLPNDANLTCPEKQPQPSPLEVWLTLDQYEISSTAPKAGKQP